MNIDGLLMIRNSIPDQLHESKRKEKHFRRDIRIISRIISEGPFIRFQAIDGENTFKDWVNRNYSSSSFDLSIQFFIDLALDPYTTRSKNSSNTRQS